MIHHMHVKNNTRPWESVIIGNYKKKSVSEKPDSLIWQNWDRNAYGFQQSMGGEVL